MTLAEFEEFRDVQIRPRADWPATFSCNQYEEVWPFLTYGWHAEEQRLHLAGAIPLLDEIVADLLSARPEGGRFHITDEGVYWADSEEQVSRFTIV